VTHVRVRYRPPRKRGDKAAAVNAAVIRNDLAALDPAVSHPLSPGEAREVAEDIWLCLCARCAWIWVARGAQPKSCASCKDTKWRHLPGTLRLGRPRAKARAQK